MMLLVQHLEVNWIKLSNHHIEILTCILRYGTQQMSRLPIPDMVRVHLMLLMNYNWLIGLICEMHIFIVLLC